ncbi:unnamed protein product [Calypogeia fissa]
MPGPEQHPGVASPVPTPEAAAAARQGGGGSTKLPPSRFHTYLYSGSRKHVFVGLLIFSAVTCAPWFLLTSGSKHQNHGDYMDAAEKARQSRLSSSTTRSST